jgi:hypothetical protein
MMEYLTQSASLQGANAAVIAAWIAAGVSVLVALLNVVHDNYQRKKDRAENTRAVMDLGLREDLAVANSLEVQVDSLNVSDNVYRSIILVNHSAEPYLDLILRCESRAHLLRVIDFGEGGCPESVYGKVREIGILNPGMSISTEVKGANENREVVPILDFMLPSGRRFVHQSSRSVPKDVAYPRWSRRFFRNPNAD